MRTNIFITLVTMGIVVNFISCNEKQVSYPELSKSNNERKYISQVINNINSYSYYYDISQQIQYLLDSLVYFSDISVEQNAVTLLKDLNYRTMNNYDDHLHDIDDIIKMETFCIDYVISNQNETLTNHIFDILLTTTNDDKKLVEYLKMAIKSELLGYGYSESFCEQLAIMSYNFSVTSYPLSAFNVESTDLISKEEIVLLYSIDIMFRQYVYAYNKWMQIQTKMPNGEFFVFDNNACYEQFRNDLIRVAAWATADAINLGIGFALTSFGTFGAGAPLAAAASFFSAGLITFKLLGDVVRLYSDYNSCVDSKSYEYFDYNNKFIIKCNFMYETVKEFAHS